jgi:hypothetical protein
MAYKVILGGQFYVWTNEKPRKGTLLDVPAGRRAAANGAVKVEVTDIEDVKRSGRDTVYRVSFEPKVY